MEYRELGKTGLKVSRLCFGSLTISPLQANLTPDEGARVMQRAFSGGVNFIDTAKIYLNYPHIARAIADRPSEIIVATKSYDYRADQMRKSLASAMRELGRDYIDIFLLHEQESRLTIRGHWEALEYLCRQREKGTVRAVGISTHYVAGVRAAAAVPEIDVIHPLWNMAGFGIADGDAAGMMAAVKEACRAGKGIYAMKVLGGGHLLGERDEAMRAALRVPEFASVAIGMQTAGEVEYNVRLVSGRRIPKALRGVLAAKPRRLLIEEWCLGCGECITACRDGALQLSNGRAVVNPGRCRLCSYCAAKCPEFCIKVI